MPSISGLIEKNLSAGLLIKDLYVAFINTLIILLIAISESALIFSGSFAAFFSQGLVMIVTSLIVTSLLFAIFSQSKITAVITQDISAILLSIMVTSITHLFLVTQSQHDLIMTVVATVIISGFFTAFLLMFLGTLRIGKITNYLPFPVIAGILAGTGLLIMQFSWIVLTGGDVFHLSTFKQLIDFDLLSLWLPAVLLSSALFITMRKSKNIMIIPFILLLSSLIFYITLQVLSSRVSSDILANQFLLHIEEPKTLFNFYLPRFGQADWMIILKQSGQIIALAIITSIGLLINISGIQLDLRENIDFNKELKIAGIANVFSCLASGGIMSYHSLANTHINQQLGARSRFVGIFIALIRLAFLLFGINYITLIPKFILVGIMFHAGFNLFYNWLIEPLSQHNRSDFFLSLVVVISMLTLGVFFGVMLGLLLSLIIFSVKYARIKVIKKEFTGSTITSNVKRDIHSSSILRQNAQAICILQL